MPELNFYIESAEVLPFAVAPTLQFKLRVENRMADVIRSIMLKCQIQIVTSLRSYTPGEQERLVEVFGTPNRWGTTLKTMFWTHTLALVPTFTGSTIVNLPIPCTYDFEVVNAKYFSSLEGGEIPLEFLFSGTLFYEGALGLQVAQIAWDKEATFKLPVGLWRQMMEHYYPNSAWLRLRRDIFDQLYSYRARRGLSSWEAAVEELLRVDAEKVRVS